jgi:hypothetical protein
MVCNRSKRDILNILTQFIFQNKICWHNSRHPSLTINAHAPSIHEIFMIVHDAINVGKQIYWRNTRAQWLHMPRWLITRKILFINFSQCCACRYKAITRQCGIKFVLFLYFHDACRFINNASTKGEKSVVICDMWLLRNVLICDVDKTVFQNAINAALAWRQNERFVIYSLTFNNCVSTAQVKKFNYVHILSIKFWD